MSYISAVHVNDEIIVWERGGIGQKREQFSYPAPYYFYVPNKKGTEVSMYGDKLRKITYNTNRELRAALEECKEKGIRTFESDIPPVIKLLSEKYYNAPVSALHVTFLDIEVDYDPKIGFASTSNPYAPINSIAMYHKYNDTYVVLCVPPDEREIDKKELVETMNSIAEFETSSKLEIEMFDDEYSMLKRFVLEIQDSDVLSGWNSNIFDLPYLGKRLELMGKRYFRQLSFPGVPLPRNNGWREIEIMGNMNTTLDLTGRIPADYMVLLRKYEGVERPSYKLESVAEDILKNRKMKKLEYEGSLADLYRKDFPYFLRYNIRDTEILKAFEETLKYVELANQMCHLSTGLFEHVTGTLKLAEFATINYCHHILGGLIVNDTHPPEHDQSIQGAYVLEPKVGLHEWIGSIDINSLYPSCIRSINISPETLIGQFTNKTEAVKAIADNNDINLVVEYNNETTEEKTASEWRKTLTENKWAVSGYGTIFSQEKRGIIPTILEDWYATRKKYQKLKSEAKTKEDSEYYDRLQYVYKIKLNSFYGALSNRFFRFYDLRMGESTTGTGRMILSHQCAKVNQLLVGEYDPTGEAIIYGDTDSSYFKTFATNKEEAIQVADAVAERTNKSFKKFMRDTFLCTPGFDDIIKTGREIVSDRGIFVEKKRYVLHVADKEGKAKDELKVMGLELKKTILPKHVGKRLEKFIEEFLKGESWDTIAQQIVEYKDELTQTDDIMLIGLPKGVKGVDEYTTNYNGDGDTRLPGHVAAAIFYNKCLKEFKDKKSPVIVSGMKIRVFYLTQMYGRFKSIAIPGDIEVVPKWFLENFNVDKEAHIKRLVDDPLKHILKAIGKKVPSKQSLVVDSLLEF